MEAGKLLHLILVLALELSMRSHATILWMRGVRFSQTLWGFLLSSLVAQVPHYEELGLSHPGEGPCRTG